MALQVYNSLSREKEVFEPIQPGRVHMYVCGPTVYNDAHLGHAKTYINFDVMVRYLRYLGYDVLYVQNITDVGHLLADGEDRMERGARREQVHPMQLAERYTRRYFRDMDALNVLRPDISPRASGHVPEMIAWVQKLLDVGVAYEVNGSVYFSVAAFEDYGKLSGRRLEDARAGTRVDVVEEKRDPADFALWKRAEPEHIMRWNSPWGEGYPGWHIECTVMSIKYLGQPFDIHGGGVENKFPHHECEIAQAEAATGKLFARYWLHNGMLMIQGEEMHKSLGNFVTIEEACQRWDPMAIRLFVLQGHYRSPLDVTEASLDAAAKGLNRLQSVQRHVRRRLATAPAGQVDAEIADELEAARAAFERSMDDDFNTSGAIAALFDATRGINACLNSSGELSKETLQAIDAFYDELGGDVLGVLSSEGEQGGSIGLTPELLDLLVATRAGLRERKAFDLADEIRDALSEMGVELQDGAEGTTWSIR